MATDGLGPEVLVRNALGAAAGVPPISGGAMPSAGGPTGTGAGPGACAGESVVLEGLDGGSDELLAGAVTNALNMAAVSAEEASRLKPFIGLIDKLGAFAGHTTRLCH